MKRSALSAKTTRAGALFAVVAPVAVTLSGCGSDWLVLEVRADCGTRQCDVGTDFDAIEISLWEIGSPGMSPQDIATSGRSQLVSSGWRI